jgi:protein TonB
MARVVLACTATALLTLVGCGQKLAQGVAPVVSVPEPIRGLQEGMTLPVVLADAKPVYTPEAMRMGIYGDVVVDAVVEVDGSVREATIVQSIDDRYGLDDAAVRAAKQFKFKPATMNGKPVRSVVTIEMTFTLRR